jgi:hypothetical protein
MESSLRHVIEYDAESYPTVSALAESLVANERLVKEAVLLLEAFAPGLIVENTTYQFGGSSKSRHSSKCLWPP